MLFRATTEPCSLSTSGKLNNPRGGRCVAVIGMFIAAHLFPHTLIIMKNTVLTLFLFVVCIHLSVAADGWNVGYIIQLNGDTVAGLIKNQDSRGYAEQCFFKTGLSANVSTYAPADLKAYRLGDGRCFVSRTFSIRRKNYSCFLEFMIKGKLNIYHLQTDSSYYFAEKDGILNELRNSEQKVLVNDATFIKYKREYVGMLSYLMADADMTDEIQKSKLRGNELIRLARNYHEKVCSSEKCIIYERPKTALLLHRAFMMGTAFSSLNFGGEIVTDAPRMTPLAGIRLELENSVEWAEQITISFDCHLQYLNRFSLRPGSDDIRNEVDYNGNSYVMMNNNRSVNSVNRLPVEMKTLLLRMPVAFNYYFSQTRWRPYAGIGAVGFVTIRQNETLAIEPVYAEFGQSVPAFLIGYTGRAGIKHITKDKLYFFAEIAYEKATNMNVNQFLRVRNENIILCCGIGF